MIAHLEGRVADIETDRIVLELGGVGFWVFVPDPFRESLRVGRQISVHTYLVVREDALTLYGFETKEERDYFGLLLGVNGVGPRLALATLSALDPTTIRRAVSSEQPEVFTRVSGIGKRTSQKMMLYLEGRLETRDELEQIAAMPEADTQVIEALTALGYSVVEAQAAVQSIPKDSPDDIEERIRLALQYFA